MYNKVYNFFLLLVYYCRILDRLNVGYLEKKNFQNIFNYELIDDNIWFFLLQVDNYFLDN